MTRLFTYLATGLFWLAVAAFWAGGHSAPPPAEAPAAPALRAIALAEVARHAVPEDCWMAIAGKVYDVTPYLPDHPSRPSVILPWCGREASEAYRTKTKGRPHSPEADRLLSAYLVGRLSD